MARTAAGGELTRRHRGEQLRLRAATVRDLTALWGTVDPTNLRGTIGRFADAAAVVVRGRNGESAEVARQYLRRFVDVEVGGRPTLPRVLPPPSEVAAAAVRGAGLSGIINARRAGFSPQAAARNGLVKLAGTASNLVLAGGRRTILETSVGQVRRSRWHRVTGADPCQFCLMLADRGAVFHTGHTASFEAHDHCSCMAELELG